MVGLKQYWNILMDFLHTASEHAVNLLPQAVDLPPGPDGLFTTWDGKYVLGIGNFQKI